MLGLSRMRRAISTARGRVAGLGSAALIGAAALGLSAAPALAQDGVQADIYVGSMEDDEKAIAVFAFDDPNTSEFAPIDALAIYAVPGYVPDGGQFDPRQGCRFTGQFDAQLDLVVLQSTPIYGPNSGKDSVAFLDLPAFFAQQALQVMVDRGQIAVNSPSFAYYTSCISFVWARQLSQPEEVWREIVEQVAPQ